MNTTMNTTTMNTAMNTTKVPGLFIQYNFIGENAEKNIIEWLDKNEWSTTLSRRTQHYGYEYSYNSSGLIPGKPFEGWISWLASWVTKNNIMESIDQCIVNEYYRDQKIGKHIDGKNGNKPNIFSDKILSISLNEDTNFIFCNGKIKEEIYVPKRSLLLMTRESRYIWTHEIPKRTTVNIDGKNVKKSENYRRISLTFRKTV